MKERDAWGEKERCVSLGKLSLGELVAMESLPVKNLDIMSAVIDGMESGAKLTIQAKGIAHGGISSLQKLSTVERAVISKGISKALQCC
jgi:hypothetical protein